MNKSIGGIMFLAALAAIPLVIVSTLIGALVGAFTGWIVGYTFLGTWILEFLRAVGIDGITTVHLGTTCGFIGGFFKAELNYKLNYKE